MLQRLPKALAQVKAGNTSDNLLNDILQICSLHRANKTTRKVCNNNTRWILYRCSSIQLW